MTKVNRQATYDECVDAFNDAIEIWGYTRDYKIKPQITCLLGLVAALEEDGSACIKRVVLHYRHTSGSTATAKLAVFGSPLGPTLFLGGDVDESSQEHSSDNSDPVLSAAFEAEEALNKAGATWIEVHKRAVTPDVFELALKALDDCNEE